ncbi:hypothetical protein PVAND_009918 [Polypedilum vanderplanki]|uniref:Uncharacterized protein n=1 Tax=Polypedilum vanderplanki TaxID=319348 RepID=A0A9J6CE93_POLVA|nr:hypothetical protein PVAND_009918 [Polypedilum vanderplanki]
MTVGTYQRQQQTQQQQQFMTQRNFGMNFYAANQQQPLMTDTKGLLNGPGQNNCFLNCAVQPHSSQWYTKYSNSINACHCHAAIINGH